MSPVVWSIVIMVIWITYGVITFPKYSVTKIKQFNERQLREIQKRQDKYSIFALILFATTMIITFIMYM